MFESVASGGTIQFHSTNGTDLLFEVKKILATIRDGIQSFMF